MPDSMQQILKQLRAERDKLDKAINSLESIYGEGEATSGGKRSASRTTKKKRAASAASSKSRSGKLAVD